MLIKLSNYIEEDFINYKKPSLFLGFPYCTFKCEKECGMKVCQNSRLMNAQQIEIDTETILRRYERNFITAAIVCGGLEPFDTEESLFTLIEEFRKQTDDDIIIYTGYNKNEIPFEIDYLKQFSNIYIKFGRYIPNESSHLDEVLGVYLASSNQYGEKIS